MGKCPHGLLPLAYLLIPLLSLHPSPLSLLCHRQPTTMPVRYPNTGETLPCSAGRTRADTVHLSLTRLRLCQGWKPASRLGVAKGGYEALAGGVAKRRKKSVASLRHVGILEESNVSGRRAFCLEFLSSTVTTEYTKVHTSITDSSHLPLHSSHVLLSLNPSYKRFSDKEKYDAQQWFFGWGGDYIKEYSLSDRQGEESISVAIMRQYGAFSSRSDLFAKFDQRHQLFEEDHYNIQAEMDQKRTRYDVRLTTSDVDFLY